MRIKLWKYIYYRKKIKKKKRKKKKENLRINFIRIIKDKRNK